MTAPRRALPAPPSRVMRIAQRLTTSARHDRLVSALEDQADRYDALSRQYRGERSLLGLAWAQAADDTRRLLEEHA